MSLGKRDSLVLFQKRTFAGTQTSKKSQLNKGVSNLSSFSQRKNAEIRVNTNYRGRILFFVSGVVFT
jgi:hypothetical protein